MLLVGAARIESGAIDAGDLVQVAYLFTLLAFPIRAIGWVLGELPRVGRRLGPGARRARGDAAGWPYGAVELGGRRRRRRRSTCSDVRFGYDDAPVLHDVTFTVGAGRTVAVVGPTGSGKSTLTTLLVRLVDPASGEVVLDGVDLRAVARGGVAGAAAVVPQQTFLFDDTVRGNVTLGLDVPDDAVRRALAVAQADRFVDALPDGLDTRIGERGMTLSGGQRQRLALARALVRSPRLLVMDDATSSVDPRVEAAILAGLRSSSSESRRARRRSWSWRTARRPSRWPTRSSTSSTAGWSTAARTSSCSPAAPATGADHGVRARGRRARRPRRRRGHRPRLLTRSRRPSGPLVCDLSPRHAGTAPGVSVNQVANDLRLDGAGSPGRLGGTAGLARHGLTRACGFAKGRVRDAWICSRAMRTGTALRGGTAVLAGLVTVAGLTACSGSSDPQARHPRVPAPARPPAVRRRRPTATTPEQQIEAADARLLRRRTEQRRSDE